jgi:uncharacterized protein
MTDLKSVNESDVYNAISRRDYASLRTLLGENKQLVESNPYGQADEYGFLYLVAVKGDAEAVKVFVDCGADVNREGPSPLFLTPLCSAAEMGQLDVARMLLEKGALVDGTDFTAASPLMLAAREGHAEVVKLLLNAGAELNRLGCVQRFLPVDFSRWHDRKDIEQLLRAHGGISVTENFDWQSQRGYPIISHVSNDGGPVYPLAFTRDVGGQPFSFRLAEIRAKTKPLFLFSSGLYECGQMVELAFALNPYWPLRQRYVAERSLASFPLDLLQRTCEMIARGQPVEASSVFDRRDPAFSDLAWPRDVTALVAVNHRWPTDNAINVDQHDKRDEVTILTLVPILFTDKSIEDAENAKRWAAKKQTAAWAKITLPLSYS